MHGITVKIVLVKHIHHASKSGGTGWALVMLLVLGLVSKFFWIIAALLYLLLLIANTRSVLRWTALIAAVAFLSWLPKTPTSLAIAGSIFLLFVAWLYSPRKALKEQPSGDLAPKLLNEPQAGLTEHDKPL